MMQRQALLLLIIALTACIEARAAEIDLPSLERQRVLKAAEEYLSHEPVTVTASHCERSLGGPHDYYSEGDYWWPNPEDPDGPYIRRDGMSNPDVFFEHRRAMRMLSLEVPALAAAWKLTGDTKYAAHAARHVRAWFIDEATRMNPHLKYAQAIRGVTPGRGIGIIDTLHLVEVARAIELLEDADVFSESDVETIHRWFADYIDWMTTSEAGIEERDEPNNHGTCWLLQVAAFADLIDDEKRLAWCRDRFKSFTTPVQFGKDGGFPAELGRTKPYSYSLFVVEAAAGVCQILSTPDDNLWTFETDDGRGMRRAMEFVVPYIADKKSWPKPPDVMYDSEWPRRQASVLFAGLAFDRPDYLELWQRLPGDSNVEEVTRNYFIRQPLLWID